MRSSPSCLTTSPARCARARYAGSRNTWRCMEDEWEEAREEWEEEAQQGSEEGSEEDADAGAAELWRCMQLTDKSGVLKAAPPPQPLARPPASRVTQDDLVMQALPRAPVAPPAAPQQTPQQQEQQHPQQQRWQWLITLVKRLADSGVAGLRTLGKKLALGELGEKLGMDPFPGNLERVVLVSGSIVPFNRTSPLTPAAAMAINEAVASGDVRLNGTMEPLTSTTRSRLPGNGSIPSFSPSSPRASFLPSVRRPATPESASRLTSHRGRGM